MFARTIKALLFLTRFQLNVQQLFGLIPGYILNYIKRFSLEWFFVADLSPILIRCFTISLVIKYLCRTYFFIILSNKLFRFGMQWGQFPDCFGTTANNSPWKSLSQIGIYVKSNFFEYSQCVAMKSWEYWEPVNPQKLKQGDQIHQKIIAHAEFFQD